MKKDKLIKFEKIREYAHSYYGTHTGLRLCRNKLHEYFEFPDTKKIVIRLSKTSHKGAYKLVGFNTHDDLKIVINKDRIEEVYMWASVDNFLKSYGFPCYASLEY